MSNDDRPGENGPVGYKNPPGESRFQKGKSGNPRGRPKKVPTFLDDAAAILSVPVTGRAQGKQITLPVMAVVFQRLCREALRDDKAALRLVIGLILTLGPGAQQTAEQNAKTCDDAKRKLLQLAGLDPDKLDVEPKEPDPKFAALRKQAAAMAKEEQKRLILEGKWLGRI